MASRLGLSVKEWEDMTPRIFRAWATGRGDAIEDANERTNSASYTLACLVRAAIFAKRMPEPERFFGRRDEEPMTDEKMYENVRALNRMLGGSED